MNFLKGTLRRAGGSAWVEIADGAKLPAPSNGAGSDGQAVVYGARPEHLDISGEDSGAAAIVEVVEPTGADTFVYATLAGTQVCAVFAERHDFRAGATIRWQPRPGLVHLFDAESGRNLN